MKTIPSEACKTTNIYISFEYTFQLLFHFNAKNNFAADSRKNYRTLDFYTINNNPLRSSQETHYVFHTKTSRLKLSIETIAVHCENHTEPTNTLCGQNVEFNMLKQVVHIEPLGLKMLNKKKISSVWEAYSQFEDTDKHLCYWNDSINVYYANNHCLTWKPNKTHKSILRSNIGLLTCKFGGS
jgi:hypothetical protein